MTPNIREEIVSHRRERLATGGHAQGMVLPTRRGTPIVTFPADPPLICEVKRRSPSRGTIASDLDPVVLAGAYASAGARSISVLTEERYFGGSLADLMAVKAAYPGCAVLRKDFLVDAQDIEVSYRAGADAVLLIASVLSRARLQEMMRAAQKRGLEVLVELHDVEDVEKVRPLHPRLVGINARDLTDFTVDLLAPLRLHGLLDWEHRAVFESGIFTGEDARLARCNGFSAILVGEAVVRDPHRIPDILSGLTDTGRGPATMHPSGDFWARLASRAAPGSRRPRTPLVKVCGLTNCMDAERAVDLGADVLGFVFARSPRRAVPELLREIAAIDVLKVAVVVSGGGHGPLSEDVSALLADGLIDAVQFHGDETPDDCTAWAYPYYKAVRLASVDDAVRVGAFGSPRVLVDARTSTAYGGTGTMIGPDLIRAVSDAGPLWLAGGLDEGNIGDVIRLWHPELVDASSGLETAPGRKDHARLERFFREVSRA